ncbi:hypothetical protein DPMN_171638 [Dreissena polymorpha]|uniref:Uncharacterized protein n=1 Tax=Dreissena polymorpha TaxID=45954 RepID=A0A9D4E030_DREPO|nr:hypothetical protein DPMN_171638 [Dreissena polymorpha]
MERIEMIGQQLSGNYLVCVFFGSQSEGTTIPGLQSDIGFLFSNKSVNIMRVWEDWEA